ncbi:hypothetical protein BJY16_007685 [Actinoplanes octamycinicus]|uniref:Uncharacterized protein n=1 Tax=Actinoplanes octamycinicus TaxID=135948 RepID=A0A7W7MBN5_9ACTN|nr:hypothetical protein [Actinoplanes octamycinicus]MBB4744226.1 hypothetical protein [Actinoplanes octamycinicus]
MVTVATIGFSVGALLVGGAGIFFLLHLGDRREARTLREVHPAPIGSWDGGRVAAEARTEYGHAGRQVGPVSGADCTWYHVLLVREPSRRSSDDSHDVLLDITAPGWPAIADASGRIPVDPRALGEPLRSDPAPIETTRVSYRRSAPVRLPAVVPPDIVDGLRQSERLELTEVRLPRGVDVFALGRTTADGLVPAYFTTRTRAEALAARLDDLALSRRLIAGFGLTGLLLAGASVVVLRTLS